MLPSFPVIATLAGLIEFGGAIVIAGAVVGALATLDMGRNIRRARLLVIAGSLSGLGFKTAATLLKAIELGTWNSIGMFVAVLALRTVIKQVFLWERGRLSTSSLREAA